MLGAESERRAFGLLRCGEYNAAEERSAAVPVEAGEINATVSSGPKPEVGLGKLLIDFVTSYSLISLN
jgi:hypothetical protein